MNSITFVAASRVPLRVTRRTWMGAGTLCVLAVLGYAVGYVAWLTPETLVALLVLPVAASFAASRKGVFALMLGYFWAGDVDLPGIMARFFAHPNPFVEYGLPVLSTVLLAAPFLLVPPRQRSWQRAAGYLGALAILSLPPLGFFGWRNPLFLAGDLFPGLGILGLAAMAALFASLVALRGMHGAGDSPRTKLLRVVPILALLVLSGLCVRGGYHHGVWRVLDWAAVDTKVMPAYTPAAQTAHTREALHAIAAASSLPWTKVILLPESAIEPYRPVDEAMLFEPSDVAKQRGQAIVFGAEIPTGPDTWEDALLGAGTLALPSGAPRMLTQARLPMPVSGWHLGLPGGETAHPFGSDAGRLDGIPVAWSICYEDLVLWPHPSLLLGHAEALVALDNDWALSGTRTAVVQHLSALMLARIAGVPLVSARNDPSAPHG